MAIRYSRDYKPVKAVSEATGKELYWWTCESTKSPRMDGQVPAKAFLQLWYIHDYDECKETEMPEVSPKTKLITAYGFEDEEEAVRSLDRAFNQVEDEDG